MPASATTCTSGRAAYASRCCWPAHPSPTTPTFRTPSSGTHPGLPAGAAVRPAGGRRAGALASAPPARRWCPVRTTPEVTVSAPLTAGSTVAAWLDHPSGGPLLRELLAAGGQDETALAPVRLLPLERLVALSGGRLPAEAVADLVRRAAPDPGGDDDAGAIPPGVVAGAGPVRPPWRERTVPGRFAGQTVVVTGAGSGIGRATASRAAREGGRVVAVDVVAERLDALAADLGPRAQQAGGELVVVVADITAADGVARVVEAAGPDVAGLANVAGVMDDMTPVHEVTDAVWERVMRVNVDGMMRLTRAVVPLMLARGGGSVVNVASEAALRGSAAGAAYTTSKHAVVGLTRSSAVMYARLGIRVNAVAPGPVITGIEARFASALGAERVGGLLATLPEPAQPEHLAASITFLLSDDGVNVSGAVLASDGGWSAQ
ncbi:SDR family oxidoreductase [Quadrisphaera sp. RL12-1S]|nr:SDR family NAD(P)-dependent oxidoreductase [Quadrisphaera sp. RL12-1S]MBC3763355.1 SDR family oxidoreductase [Quadrisphaera sp. RL12-1S]